MTKIVWSLVATLVLAGWNVAAAQQAPTVAGDYVGTLGPLSLRLHIVVAPDGTLSGTLDSPNQAANGIRCSDFVVDGKKLSFKVPDVNGTWQGSIEDGGAKLSGTWSQGTPRPLVFSRDTFVPADKPSPVDGIWLGTAQVEGRAMRTQLVVKTDAKGAQHCAVDSIDAFVYEIQCTNAKLAADRFSFDVPPVNARWSGTLSKDGTTLVGTWAQEQSQVAPAIPPFTLKLTRQAQRVTAATAFPITYDDPIAPVSAANMESVLRRDLEQTLRDGALSPNSPIGIAIGVIRDGEHRVFAFGKAQPDAVFEIGSISKTFTGLLLAQAIEQGAVKIDTAVRNLLPPNTVAKPSAANEITLLDLVTQRSGLPRMPSNFRPKDPANPYADYGSAQLYEFIREHGVAKPADPRFVYSNLGFGLLGQALANHSNMDYAALLEQAVLAPLDMRNTQITLDAEHQRRFIQGHSPDRKPAQPWDLVAFAGAGGIRSTAADMLKYLEANLRQRPAQTPTTPYGRTLPAALARSQTLQADAGGTMKVAYAWLHETTTGTYWHNGGTGGFSSYAFFNPKGNYAGIVLVNMTLSPRGSLADTIGNHINDRFAGRKAISLADW